MNIENKVKSRIESFNKPERQKGVSNKVTDNNNMDLRNEIEKILNESDDCLLYTSPSPRDGLLSRMPSSA